MSNYVKVFDNPYPSGWENLPSQRTAINANSLQQHTSSVAHIEDYLADNPIPEDLSDLNDDVGYAKTSDIPTNVSQLTNDSGYVTMSEVETKIPTKTSELTNDSNFATKDEIPTVPTKTSELLNDSGFITKVISDLTNYYTKQETYTKSEVSDLLSSFKNWSFEIVDELPSENISTTTVYCILKTQPSPQVVVDDLSYDLLTTPITGDEESSSFPLGNEIVSEEEIPEDS